MPLKSVSRSGLAGSSGMATLLIHGVGMKQTGIRNPAVGIEAMGIRNPSAVHYNHIEPELYEAAIRRGEAELTAHGALSARTGQHTGRSAKDKFILRDAVTEATVWWDNNKPMEREAFDRLHADFLAH